MYGIAPLCIAITLYLASVARIKCGYEEREREREREREKEREREREREQVEGRRGKSIKRILCTGFLLPGVRRGCKNIDGNE